MLDFSKSRAEAIQLVSPKFFELNLLTKASHSHQDICEAWGCQLECDLGDRVEIVCLRIELTYDFPYRFPRIFVEEKSLPLIGIIPHLTRGDFICTYEEEYDLPDPHNPGRLLYESIVKARSIIEDGVSGKNSSDLEIEFANYWREQYSSEYSVETDWLSLIDEDYPHSIKILRLSKAVGGFSKILYSKEEQIAGFNVYLSAAGIKTSTDTAFFIDKELNLFPPFPMTNYDAFKIVSGINRVSEFDKHISESSQRVVICRKRIGNQTYYLGWKHAAVPKNVNGWRSPIKAHTAFANFHRTKHIQRLICTNYSVERFQYRTSGMLNTRNNSELKLGFVGLGSIGSNLLHFCRSLGATRYFLMDKDSLEVENIPRHLLGFDYCSKNKTDAVRSYLLSYRPELNIEISNEDVSSFAKSNFRELNTCDYNFICIGNSIKETWISDMLVDGVIEKPCIFLWVEPYLAAGHMVFIHPSDPKRLSDYFIDDYYIHSILSNDNQFESMRLREAGCSSSFTPYGGADLMEYLSAMFSIIHRVKITNESKSFRAIWCGRFPSLGGNDLVANSAYDETPYGTLIETVL